MTAHNTWLPALAAAALFGATAHAAEADPDRQVASRVAEVRKLLGPGFIIERSAMFVVAGNLAPARFRRILRGTVGRCSQALWASYCQKKPDYPITIYLFKDDATYREYARKLFGDKEVSHFGYYRPWDQTLVMNIGTGTGTLVHEMTHALVKPDFPDIPTWFDEGLASLHEQCQVAPTKITGLTNWRLAGLQKAIREGRLVPLATLVAMTTAQFRGPGEGLHYAEARYLAMYLQKQGKLRDFYRKFRDNFKKDRTGAHTLEAVTGKPAAALQAEWVAWVETLRYPPR